MAEREIDETVHLPEYMSREEWEAAAARMRPWELCIYQREVIARWLVEKFGT